MSVYVTDTDPLLWYATKTFRKLSPKVRRVFDRALRGEALIWIPAMVIWEAGLLHRIGRVRFKQPFRDWADALVAHPGFPLAPLDLDVVYWSLDFEPNSDLFDVAIVATALRKDLPLITKDEIVVRSGAVDTYW